MNNEEYMQLLYAIHRRFEKDPIIISWENGLKVKCVSSIGIEETDIEPDEDDYIGDYVIVVTDVEILQQGSDDSIFIFNNAIEISLVNIPDKVMLLDGTVLWSKN